MSDLGPTTESRFAETFATRAVITRKAAAALIGLDEKTLDALSDAKVIRAVRIGARRGYVERDLRSYLIEGPDVECPPLKPKAAPQRDPKVLNFSERRQGARRGRAGRERLQAP